MTESFLIYDGGNELFRGVAKRVARLSDDVRLVPWRAEYTRRFLEAQFGDHLFVFVLIEPDTDTVYAGTRTIRRLLCARGVPESLVDTAERAYRALGDPFGRIVHRQAPADINGTFPIAEEAKPHVGSLRRNCSLASCVAEDVEPN